jgi:hypothetical protein
MGAIANEARRATRARRIRRAGWRQASMASTMAVRKTAVAQAASNTMMPMRSIQTHMA